MPELPEVEHSRRDLERWIRRATIVATKGEGKFALPSLRGRRIETVERRGKWIRIVLSDATLLFNHHGMTGEWKRSDEPLRWERASLVVEKNGKRTRVAYVDPRKFGRLVVAREDIPSWSALGPDPLEHGIDAKALADKLARRRKRSIKEALMDQSVLAGVGNIQATEALWKARIDPRSPAGALAKKHVTAVIKGLRWTIARTLDDLDVGFVIYGHKGEPCPRCKTTLVRIVLGGRTTTFCPGCQERLRARP